MIQMTMFDSVLEVKIKGPNFNEELKVVKEMFDVSDRHFDDGKNVWVIHNPHKYLHIPAVKRAIEERKQQMTLF